MKKLFCFVLLVSLMNMAAMADEEPYRLCVAPTHELIATFDMSDAGYIWVEADLTLETNKVEITQNVSNVTTCWYGPAWEGLHSYLADTDGYCWWTCPAFNEDGKVISSIDSSSGVNNHIGLIVPKGKYRFIFSRSALDGYYFIIEDLNSTDLTEVQTTASVVKTFVNGRLLIQSEGQTYTPTGIEVK